MPSLKNDEWEYKIGGRFQGLIPALIFLAAFGGITFWLYKSENSAYIFTGFLTAFAVLCVLLSIYRSVFLKVLLSPIAFYYQTNPFNGKKYTYNEIYRAWKSTGKLQNGTEAHYCSFETAEGQVKRFLYYPADEESIDYFINHIGSDNEIPKIIKSDKKWDYKINARNGFGFGAILLFIIFAVFTVLTIDQLRPAENKSRFLALAFGSTAVMLLFTLIFYTVRYFCFKVYIGEQGFYYQSTPFNGKFYRYADIEDCHEELKVYRSGSAHNSSSSTSYIYYFIFNEKGGKTKRFIFDKSMYEKEINTLKERIQNAL